MKNKNLVFPKLPENQSIEMIKQMQENRNLRFSKDGKESSKESKDGRDTPVFKNNMSLLNVENSSKTYEKKSENNIRDLIREART